VSQPLGDLGPQITTSLPRELIARDALHPPATADVPTDRAIVAR
jgi:hypothetical protein